LWNSNLLEGGDKVISQQIRLSLMSILAVTYNTKMKTLQKRRNCMKRFLATSALLSLLVLPVIASADNDRPRTPRETKRTSESAASSVPADNGQKRRVERTEQATDVTASPDPLKRSIDQYNAVNPSAITD
jgi:hypothetical protein